MDCTKFLQEQLDRGGTVTIPAGLYEISNTLYIGDCTRLVCEAGAVLRLADGANCPILHNRIAQGKTYTESITVEGGVWDGNNVGQDRAAYPAKNNAPDSRWGQLMVFTGVKDLTVRDLTIKDPNSFGIMLTDTERFTVRDCYFDCNDKTLNQDGVHVNGWAKDGLIANLKGHTNDDFVALNADEGIFSGPENDIENVVIDGIWGGGNGWTGVRLLSREAKVKHITVRNVFGAYKFNAVSFTHWSNAPEDYGFFDDILLENLHVSSCRRSGTGHGGLIWFQGDTRHVGNVVIRNVFRTEPEENRNSTVLIDIGDRVKIDRLTLNGLYEKVPDEKPSLILGTDAEPGTVLLDGRRLTAADFPIKL